MDAIIEKALALPAAILIRDDIWHFANPTDVAYEVGIQQPRRHRRFAGYFRHGDRLMLYFKHDPDEVAELYGGYPNVVLPSEIASKYWSKLVVDEAPALAERLLATSYRLSCGAATKQGRELIEQCAAQPNRFSTFHHAALELSRLENVHLSYTDHAEPCLSVGARPVAKFAWNRLSVRLRGAADSTERWDVLEPEDHREWPSAMRTSVQETA